MDCTPGIAQGGNPSDFYLRRSLRSLIMVESIF